MNIHFILVEPAVPENVGASARAIKTMGFSSLRVVNTKAHLEEKAKWVAHGSADIMENIKHFDNLADAIADMDLVIGSTAKKRRKNDEYIPASELADFIKEKATTVENIAIVFGREESGLSQEEVELCHAVTRIQMVALYPSLNLSQAVMLYSYELSKLTLETLPPISKEGKANGIKPLLEKIEEITDIIELDRNQMLYHYIKERVVMLKDFDIHKVHSLTAKILKKLNPKSKLIK